MILIDDRTGAVELHPLINSSSVVCRLPYADFAWSGEGPDGRVNVGVERKSFLDLLQSMTSGRFSGHQLIGLSEDYDWVYLLVEGVWRPDRNTGVLMRIGSKGRWIAATQGSRRFMARDVYNFLSSLTVLCGVIVVQTANQWESARWLDATHGWWTKSWTAHRSHLQFQKPTAHAHLTKPSLVARVASQLSGIGWDKARAIGLRFESLPRLMEASEDDLMEIHGIGKVLARSIIEQLHEEDGR